jgi:L-2-hydroxyglutarate oxidase
METADIVVIGAGIVGLATAWEISQRRPELSVLVIEKETCVASHQTGRNSGVLHSGIYYEPGSLKARNCVRGRSKMETFCDEYDIPWKRCGKVIVATSDDEVEGLNRIESNGRDNGVQSHRLDGRGIREIEPHVRAVAGLHVPVTGIVDYHRVATTLHGLIEASGGRIRFGHAVIDVVETVDGYRVATGDEIFEAGRVVNCAGLYSDKIAAMSGHRPDLRIVPFRGEYYRLREGREHLCRTLIYPVPDPRFPFLGVHLTSEVGGGVSCGPNAVLALAREGYGWGDISISEFTETLAWPGFRKLALRNFGYGLGELWRSLSRRSFARALQKLVPEVEPDDLVPAAAGVRAQALDRDGNLVDDFVLAGDDRITHVCNAPSPAATSAFAIGETIVERVLSG